MLSPGLQRQNKLSSPEENSFVEEELEENTFIHVPSFYVTKPYQHIPSLSVSERFIVSNTIEGKRSLVKMVQYIPLDKRAQWEMQGLLHSMYIYQYLDAPSLK